MFMRAMLTCDDVSSLQKVMAQSDNKYIFPKKEHSLNNIQPICTKRSVNIADEMLNLAICKYFSLKIRCYVLLTKLATRQLFTAR